MAITIDILEDKTVVVDEELTLRNIRYTARENGGTMYYYIRGGLNAETDLQTLIASIAQELFDDAEANGTPIPDLITKVYGERKRISHFLKAWEVLRDEMMDTTAAPPGPAIINHVLAELADDEQAANFFEAMAWRMGLTATIDTQLTPTVVNNMSAANQRILFQLIVDFMSMGLGVGLTGYFILDEYLKQS